MSSTLLGDQERLGRMCQLFDVEYLMPLVTVTDEVKKNYLNQSERAIEHFKKLH